MTFNHANIVEDSTHIYYIFIDSPYFPLDNFHPAVVKFEGLMYRNSEAAFQAAKLKTNAERKARGFHRMDANTSKMVGKNPRVTKIRNDWEQIKDQVMYGIVKDKMQRHPWILELLLATGNKVIEEGNTWNDEYWGVDRFTRQGRNQLGLTLMTLREEFNAI